MFESMSVFGFADKFDTIWDILKDEEYPAQVVIWCALGDIIAGQEDRHGYELAEEVLPIMHQVGNEQGVFKDDYVV